MQTLLPPKPPRRVRGLLAALLLFAAPVLAQSSAQSPAQIAAAIKGVHPKTVVFIFDVSESTRAGGVFRQERAATATILRQGCAAGDRVVLETFGTGFKTVWDRTLATAGEANALISQMPDAPEPGRGTNIRWPHHEALKIVNAGLPKPGIIVLLTDSFNDRPAETDPNYPKYLDYYTLKGLTVYPNTGQNRDYERLLAKLTANGKLTQFGVGIGLADNGRPIERLPVGAGQDDNDASAAASSAPIVTNAPQEKTASNLPLILGVAALALLAILAAVFGALNKPVAVRLKLSDKGAPRDYKLKPGAKIALGGSPVTAGAGDDVFPLAGLPAPIAFVMAARGGASLVPGEIAPGAGVFHNGVKLEQTTPLSVGDEVRISLPATSDAAPREHRIRFADPREAAF